jgi:hypothetical protein
MVLVDANSGEALASSSFTRVNGPPCANPDASVEAAGLCAQANARSDRRSERKVGHEVGIPKLASDR